VNWGSGELLPKTTAQFRAMLLRRTVPYWGKSIEGGKDASITLRVA
jgi:N-methylhydantoinase B